MRHLRPAAPRVVLLLAVAVVASGCSTRRPAAATAPAPVVAPPTEDVEALIERGCFRCLEQALATAEERRLPQLAVEAAALLTLRATELGMPADTWMARARTLAADDSTWTLYLEIVAAIPPDPLRGVREDLLFETQGRSRARSMLPLWREALSAGAMPSRFRQYLDLTLVCTVDTPQARDRELARLVAGLQDVPLLHYRAGICSGVYAAQLTALRSREPDFVDADYALGRYALEGDTPDPDEAMRRFQSAAAAFPSSTALPTTIGNLYQSWEEWARALAAYDSALALLPTHPDARIGRVVGLSHLERHEDAIETATRLIDGGRWYLGQAFYWRAWNRYNLADYAAARLDADRTRTLMVNSAVFVLSGLIEWRFRRLEKAESEFQEAITMDFGQCAAAFYLGAVRSERAKGPEAIAAFNQARQCYDLTIAVWRKRLADVIAGPGSPEAKARDMARYERRIAENQAKRTQAVTAMEELKKVQSVK